MKTAFLLLQKHTRVFNTPIDGIINASPAVKLLQEKRFVKVNPRELDEQTRKKTFPLIITTIVVVVDAIIIINTLAAIIIIVIVTISVCH